jgi:hypothetical protein
MLLLLDRIAFGYRLHTRVVFSLTTLIIVVCTAIFSAEEQSSASDLPPRLFPGATVLQAPPSYEIILHCNL